MKRSDNKKVTAAKIVAGFAAAAALGASVSGCFNPEENETPRVYGPPPEAMEEADDSESDQ